MDMQMKAGWVSNNTGEEDGVKVCESRIGLAAMRRKQDAGDARRLAKAGLCGCDETSGKNKHREKAMSSSVLHGSAGGREGDKQTQHG